MALDARDVNTITKRVVRVLEPRLMRIERRTAAARQANHSLEASLRREVAASNRKFYTVFTDLVILRDELAALRAGYKERRAKGESE